MKMSAWGRLRWSDAAPSGELKRHLHGTFAFGLAIRHAAHWAEPELVVQIGFARWTCDCEPRAVSLA